MMEFSDTLSDLLTNIQQAQAIQKSAQILIVFNKIDAVELSTQFQKSSDTIEALIKEKFPINNIVSKRIVSNNIANSKGLKQLFSEIVNFDTTAITHNDRDYEGIDWVNNIIKQKKMVNVNVLIAGLIGSGKSTLIGALAYAIKMGKCSYSFVDRPEDLTPLAKLYKPWLSLTPVNRTALGNSETFEFSLKKEVGPQITISIPDYAGEDFERLISKQSDILNHWGGEKNALIFLIKDFELDALEEAFVTEVENRENLPIHPFSLELTTSQVKNLLLLKELLKCVRWESVVIGISAWDRYDDNYLPDTFLKEKAPVLYNYIRHYLPKTKVIGVSAQGAEYAENLRQELSERTMNNTRSWSVINNERGYDLTKILDLIS